MKKPTTAALLFALASLSCAPVAPQAPTLPAALLEIEGTAEDAYDKALAGDFATVDSDAKAIAAGWDGYRAAAATDGAGADVLTGMDDAVAGLTDAPADRVAAGRAANAISSFMKPLFTLYAPKTPPAIIELDHAGREIALDGVDDDLAAALDDISSLAAEWDGVTADITAAGGQDSADAYDAHIVAMGDAVAADDAAALVEQANVGLELVDAMEALFE